MADDDITAAASKFGSCCAELKDAMAGEEFEPLITVGEDGVLYMTVGLDRPRGGRAGPRRPSAVLLPVLRHASCRPRTRSARRSAATRREPGADELTATETKDLDQWQAHSSSSWFRPERVLLSADAEQVVVPGAEGDLHRACRPRAGDLDAAPGVLDVTLAGGSSGSSSRAASPRSTRTASPCWPNAPSITDEVDPRQIEQRTRGGAGFAERRPRRRCPPAHHARDRRVARAGRRTRSRRDGLLRPAARCRQTCRSPP